MQTAVILSKVARLDFPKSWPSLLTELLGRLQAAGSAGPSGTLTTRRCFLALHQTLKELSTKRLAADQRTFEQITSQLLEPLWTQWGIDTNVLLSQLPVALAGGAPPSSQQAVLLVFERWLLQLKSLRRMLLFGFQSDSRTMEPVGAVEQATPHIVSTLRTLCSMVPHGTGVLRSQSAAMLARACLKLIKTLRQVAETHPWSMLRCRALLHSLDLCCTQLSTPSVRSGLVAGAITRQCLQFIHSVLRCAAYKGSPAALSLSAGKGRAQLDTLKALSAEATPLLRSFWGDKQGPLVQLIITSFLPLTAAELEVWVGEGAGEAFHAEMEHTAWEESTRGCAEQVFVALLESDREVLAPLVNSMLISSTSNDGNSNGGSNGTSETQQHQEEVIYSIPWHVRYQAAVYHALAIGAYELHGTIDFSSLLHTRLLAQVTDPTPTHRPLRRAAMKLLATWTPTMKKEERPAVYRALVTSALNDPDPAIYLAAVSALHAMLDDWDFDESQFAEFVPACLQLLATALTACEEYETQLEIFALINLIIDRLGDKAAAFAPGLLQLIPAVWQGAEAQSLLRIQVMVALQRVVHALGPDSGVAYPILLPVIATAIDPGQPKDEMQLVEDGLLLWLVALHHAPGSGSSGSIDNGDRNNSSTDSSTALLCSGLLVSHLLTMMEASTEHVVVGTKVVTSVLLLGWSSGSSSSTNSTNTPPPTVQSIEQGPRIANLLATYIGNLNERGMLCVLPVLDTLVQLYPSDGPVFVQEALQRLLLHITSPSSSPPSGIVISHALSIFARVVLSNASVFLQLFQLPSSESGTPTDLFLGLLDVWIDRFDSISSPPSRKISALALCALLTAPVPGVLSRVGGIAACVTAVWFELEGPDAGPERMGIDYLAAWSAPKLDDLPLSVNLSDAEGEGGRRRLSLAQSPVATLKLSMFCKQQMEVAASVHGAGVLNEALNGMDGTLQVQLQQMLSSA